jgi:outer membrane protein, multidrug efflux system
MIRRAGRAAVLGALSLALAGCTVGPNYKRPLVPVPDRFYGDERAAEARSLADVPWWDVFDDPILKGLIEEAVRNGFDARLSAARVQEARARYGIVRSQFFPSVDYEGGWQRGRANQNLNPSGKTLTAWSVDVEFSWELDLWGRIRRLSEAARAQYLATEEGRRGVLLSLVSDVAVAYLDLRELDSELAIAKNTTAAFQDTYDLFNRRLEGGAASGLETARAEASLAQVAAQIPEIERAIVARENQINFLLGRNPQPIPREEPLMALPPDVPPGLPSALLERRPDIRQAEELLIAANANVGAAKADFFPRLSLTGLFGNVSPELGDLFSHGKTWSVGAGLLGPIFQGGRIKRSYEAAQAQWLQAKIEYEASTANAFGEVSGALVDRTKLVETERQRARAVAAYQEAVRLANIRYDSGLSAYFEVLEAQQQLFPAEISLAQTRRDQLVAVVNLYRALGGGWQAEEKAQAGVDNPAGSGIMGKGTR